MEDEAEEDNTLFDESDQAVLSEDKLTMSTYEAVDYAGARGRACVQASSTCSFDVQVLAVGPQDSEEARRPGLEANELMIGFCTPGASYPLGAHIKKEGPAASWCFQNRKVITENKLLSYGEPFGVGDVVTATLVDGTVRFALNDQDLGQAFKLDGRDLKAVVHPAVCAKHTELRIRLDPMPLWPEVGLKFAMGRQDPEQAEQALRCDPGPPEERVSDVLSLVQATIKALELFGAHGGVVAQASQLLRRYARTSCEHQSTLVHLGAVEVLAARMEQHRTDPAVLAVVITACWNIAVRNPEAQVALSQAGVPNLIKTAMYQHPSSQALQKAAMAGILPWVLRQVPAAASFVKSPVKSPPPEQSCSGDGVL